MRAALLLLVLLLLMPAIPASAAAPVNAVGTISTIDAWFGAYEACSVWAVRPKLLVTAAHCVQESIFGFPTGKSVGETRTVTFYRGVTKHSMKAKVVWDSFWWGDEGLDVAFLVPEKPWPAVLPLASLLPKKGDKAEFLAFTLGIRRWTGYGVFDGLYDVNGLGWMLIYRSDYTGGGASGSPVIVNGKVVGMHTHGYTPLRMGLAMPVGRIRRALADLDMHGPMSIVQQPEQNGR